MELTLDNAFIFNIYKLVSVPNRNLIRWLLIHNCVSSSELCFNLMKPFHHFDQIPIQYSSFSYVFNCLLTSYLKSVVEKSSKFSALKPRLSYPTKYNLNEIFLHKFWEMSYIYTVKGIDIPIQIIKTKSDNNVEILQSTENYDRKENVFADGDFHSFLLPLEQDYTKSSKGYSIHTASTHDKVKDKNTYSVLNENKYLQVGSVSYNKTKACDVIYKDQEDELKSKNNESTFCYNALDSDVISYLQDFNSGSQQNSIQEECFTITNSKSNFNYSLRTFSDHVKQQLDCTLNNDSDSEDFVIFSEHFISKGEKCNTTKIVLHNSVNCIDSDSDDATVFSENSEKQEKEIIKEFQDNINLDTISFDDFSNWDDDFDENDPDLLEKFNLDFNRGDSPVWSCSQNKIHDKPLSTYEYDNACFEDDDDLFLFNPMEDINKNWNNSMKNVSSEPRIAKKVSFVPLPDLVSIETFDPDNDGYRYSLYVFDQVHFQNRIQEFEAAIKPYLASEHRAKVFYQNYQREKDLF